MLHSSRDPQVSMLFMGACPAYGLLSDFIKKDLPSWLALELESDNCPTFQHCPPFWFFQYSHKCECFFYQQQPFTSVASIPTQTFPTLDLYLLPDRLIGRFFCFFQLLPSASSEGESSNLSQEQHGPKLCCVWAAPLALEESQPLP